MRNNLKKNILRKIFLVMLFSSTALLAQNTIISGTVTTADGYPLPGVNVLQKDTNNGVVTDFDGNYTIRLNAGNRTVVFSYVGFMSKEVEIGNASALNIVMEENTQTLDEVLVVGYGTQNRSDLVGSVGSVKGSDLEVTPVPTFDLALQGRTAGLQIQNSSSEPGGEVTIRIRGNNSILGDNTPLIVVDGYPMPTGSEASSAGAGDGNQTGSNPLSFLNPSNIKSVEILKDASATAIYGSRGANGVLVVTTKKGNYKQGTRFNYSHETGFSEISSYPKVLDGPTYAQWRNDISSADGLGMPYNGVERPLPEDAPTTDYVQRILRTGVNQTHQLSLSGGGNRSRYFLASAFVNNKGILKETDFTRASLRLNIDNKLTDRLTTSTSLNYVRIKNNRSGEGSGAIINSGSIFRAFSNNPAALPDSPIDEGDGLNDFFNDPLRELLDVKNETHNEILILSILSKYNIKEGFDFNLSMGTNSLNSRRELYFPKTTRLGYLYGSRAVYNINSRKNYLIESYFTYVKNLNDKHNIDAAGGYSWQINDTRLLNTRVEDFPVDALGSDNIGLGLSPAIPTSARIDRTLESFYVRMNYNFDKKYYVSLTGRADGSSVFAANKKWGYFPSVGLGWTVSNESFMENLDALSNVKVRASYGITGSQSIQPLQSLTLLGTSNATFGDILYSGIAPTRLGNPDLEWEKTTQYNVGLDIGILNDRFYANVDYYTKTTNDLLLNFPLPTSAGLSSIVANAGSIENKGLEVVVGGYIIDGNKFKWNTNINWSNNKTKVLSLGDTNADIFGPAPAVNIVNNPSNVMRVGEAFSALYGYKVDGLLQESDFDTNGNPLVPIFAPGQDPGQYKYVDLDGDGVITAADQDIIGDPNPDFIFGWNNEFKYKRFSLSMFIQGSIGNDLMNVDRLFFASGRYVNNVYQDWFDNRWTPTNPTNDTRYVDGSNDQRFMQPNSAVVEDASYVRLKNVSLGYNLNTRDIPFLKGARIYATATNLLTITNYSGPDPEVNIRGGNNLAQGIDFSAYPRAKTFTLGLRASF